VGCDRLKSKTGDLKMAGKSAVSLRDFLTAVVAAAKAGNNQSEVARELGITPAAVSLRLKSLREKGVKVPELA
jgi:predicted transcriptional regulator